MADKNHPNIVRLLGFAVGGDMRTRPEQVLIYEFVPNGDLEKWLDPTMLILVVLTGRSSIAEPGRERMHILHWVEECLKGSNLACLKNPTVEVSEEVLLRLTQLALTCTVDRTASRPTMGDVANELLVIKNEVGGKEEVSAAVKVDEENEERKSAYTALKTLDEEIDLIHDDNILSIRCC
ncbi:unnamed protein product [Closterium sp. NIES-64]|nr:unnamed protein product [Closterium sp. NIES-64]